MLTGSAEACVASRNSLGGLDLRVVTCGHPALRFQPGPSRFAGKSTTTFPATGRSLGDWTVVMSDASGTPAC